MCINLIISLGTSCYCCVNMNLVLQALHYRDHKMDESSTSEQLLYFAHSSINLSNSDKLIIVEGQKLNGKHIKLCTRLAEVNVS